jgi:hypothetical protein
MSAVLTHFLIHTPFAPRAAARSRRPASGLFSRSLARLVGWAGPEAYRPEQHYMRGGTTEGSRSLAAARRQIAGRA